MKQRWAWEEEVWMGEVMTLYLDGWTLMEIPIWVGMSGRWKTVVERGEGSHDDKCGVCGCVVS